MNKTNCQMEKRLGDKILENGGIYYHAYHGLDSQINQIMQSICKTCGNECEIADKSKRYLKGLSTLSDNGVHGPHGTIIVNNFIHRLAYEINSSASPINAN